MGKEAISFSEVREFLLKLKKDKLEKEKELSYEQENSLLYTTKMQKLDPKKSKELYSKLMEKGLSQAIAINIVNIMPEEEEIIEAILGKRMKYDEKLVKEIFELVKSYL